MHKRRTLLAALAFVFATSGYAANLGVANPNPLHYDGSTTSTSITVRAPATPADFDAVIIVYDLSGRRVAEFSRGSYASTEYTVNWNARNQAGRLVKSGVYIVTVIRRYKDVSRGEESARFRIGLVRER